MTHLPLTIGIDSESGLIRISQPFSLDNPQDQYHIDLSIDQAIQVGKFLLAAAKSGNEPVACGTALHFTDIWNAYPSKRRVDKEGCLRKWRQRRLDDQIGQILPHLTAMARSDGWTKDGGQFVPMITTYLNQSRWQAEAESTTTTWHSPQV